MDTRDGHSPDNPTTLGAPKFVPDEPSQTVLERETEIQINYLVGCGWSRDQAVLEVSRFVPARGA